MWYLAVLTALMWGAADLFYKKGAEADDRYSHLRTVVMVGLVMGLFGVLYYFLKPDLRFDPFSIVKYLPVSMLYIVSMTVGYIGLRYLELSISSPIQNSSGAITALLLFIIFREQLSVLTVISIAVISAGVFLLSLYEKKSADRERALNREKAPAKYKVGALAIMFPILYCIIDAAGSFTDSIYLDYKGIVTEDESLIAYSLTFFLAGLVCFLYMTFVKKQRFTFRGERNRLAAAAFETAGQVFYVFALSRDSVVAAPVVASYCIFSVILSRIFLKEKLTRTQYLIVGTVILGIVLLAVAEELA